MEMEVAGVTAVRRWRWHVWSRWSDDNQHDGWAVSQQLEHLDDLDLARPPGILLRAENTCLSCFMLE
ncbi:hypothetical protein MHYP_G00255030 [Metynnis hypsauchen]